MTGDGYCSRYLIGTVSPYLKGTPHFSYSHFVVPRISEGGHTPYNITWTFHSSCDFQFYTNYLPDGTSWWNWKTIFFDQFQINQNRRKPEKRQQMKKNVYFIFPWYRGGGTTEALLSPPRTSFILTKEYKTLLMGGGQIPPSPNRTVRVQLFWFKNLIYKLCRSASWPN